MTSEFPRGWRFIAEGSGGIPGTTTISGVAGVSHILTDMTVLLADGTAAATTMEVIVSLNGLLIAICLLTTPGKDSDDVTFQFNAGPGNALTFTYGSSGTTANTNVIVIIQGYDV